MCVFVGLCDKFTRVTKRSHGTVLFPGTCKSALASVVHRLKWFARVYFCVCVCACVCQRRVLVVDERWNRARSSRMPARSEHRQGRNVRHLPYPTHILAMTHGNHL